MQPVVGSRHQNVARGVPGAGPNSAERTLPADYMDLHFLYGGGKSQQVSKQASTLRVWRAPWSFPSRNNEYAFLSFFLGGRDEAACPPGQPNATMCH